MKKQLIIFFCFNFLISVAQEKSYLDFINNMTPIFPGCEKAKDKSKCYNENIGNLILFRINEENNIKPFEISKIEIKLLIRTENTGKSTILRLETKDSLIKRLVNSALEKIPIVKPLYSETTKEYVASSKGFSILIQKNKETNLFELYTPKNKNDLSLKPYPNTKITKHIDFYNCENGEADNFSKCFNEQLKIWLENNIENKSKNNLKGQSAILKLTFDKTGSLTSVVTSNSNELKNILMKTLKTFPKVKPAESNGQKISISYSIPISF